MLLDDDIVWTPRHEALTFGEFMSALELCAGGATYFKEKLAAICKQFNYYQVDSSSQKLLKMLEAWEVSRG